MKLNDKVYEVLKWVALIAIPALSTFYCTVLAPACGLPYANEVSQITQGLTVLIGALIGISTIEYNKKAN